MSETRNILIIAGEASGDHHGAELVHELNRQLPEARFWGIGGNDMEAAGVDLVVHARDMAFLGFVEVIKHLPFIRKVFNQILNLAVKKKPDVAVLIDYPGFNIRLAKAMKKKKIPVVYYISPQVWAWKEGRKHTLAKVVDLMLVIFPFEEAIYQELGMDVHFVGNPLVDSVKPSQPKDVFLKQNQLSSELPTLCLLPGSRKQEVEKLLPPMIDSVAVLRQSIPNLQCVVAVANTLSDMFIQTFIKGIPCTAVHGQTHNALAASDAAIVASGTATLETALLQTPMVIVYKLAPVSYAIGRHLVKVKNIGLANIVAGQEVVPELIQGDVNPKTIAETVNPMLVDSSHNQRIRQSLGTVRVKLGEPGASKRAAEAIVDLIQ